MRQKKVDVLLAVKALDHGFRRNMDTACLIAADLDFAPLVDSLVRLGVFVRVYYEKSSAARELYTAADMGQPITLSMLHAWTESSFQQKYPLPHRLGNAEAPVPSAGYQLIQEGTLDDEFGSMLEHSPFGHSPASSKSADEPIVCCWLCRVASRWRKTLWLLVKFSWARYSQKGKAHSFLGEPEVVLSARRAADGKITTRGDSSRTQKKRRTECREH